MNRIVVTDTYRRCKR